MDKRLMQAAEKWNEIKKSGNLKGLSMSDFDTIAYVGRLFADGDNAITITQNAVAGFFKNNGFNVTENNGHFTISL